VASGECRWGPPWSPDGDEANTDHERREVGGSCPSHQYRQPDQPDLRLLPDASRKQREIFASVPVRITATCSARCWSPAVSSIAAGRYAQAAFDVALAEDTLDAWFAAAEELSALTSEKRFVRALSQADEARFEAIVAAVLPQCSH